MRLPVRPELCSRCGEEHNGAEYNKDEGILRFRERFSVLELGR